MRPPLVVWWPSSSATAPRRGPEAGGRARRAALQAWRGPETQRAATTSPPWPCTGPATPVSPTSSSSGGDRPAAPRAWSGGAGPLGIGEVAAVCAARTLGHLEHAPGEEHLAQRRAVRGTSTSVQSRVPSRYVESTWATCTTVAPGHAQVHGLVGVLADRLHRRAGQADGLLPGVVPGAYSQNSEPATYQPRRRARADRSARAPSASVSRRLGQADGLLQVGEGQREVGPDDGGDQVGRTVDSTGAA